MANHTSAKKRTRRNAQRSLVNKARLGRIRTFIKKLEASISAGDAKAAQDALQQVQPELARGVAKGVIRAQTASRKLSRLSSRVKGLK